VAGLAFWGLVACAGEDGVEGTGLDSKDLQLVQECFAQAPDGHCAATDFNNDGYINYADLVLMKSSVQFDLNLDGFVDTRESEENQDLAILTACQAVYTEDCNRADFNNDKVVDDADAALFQTAAQFDLNNDQSVDVSELKNLVVEYSEDLAILLDCLFDAPVDGCANSDLNEDNIIDFQDRDLFTEAAKYDLNGDDIIDFTNDVGVALNNTQVNEDLKIIKDCFLKSTETFPHCAIADFNGDTFVNAADLAEFKWASRLDLNADGYVDLRVLIESQDMVFIKLCFFQVAEGECTKADFNGDNIVNVGDLAEFKVSERFDVTDDGVIDLYGTGEYSDFAFISSCFFQSSFACLSADFNGDSVVNAADLAVFRGAEIYDVNLDGYVDFRVRDALESRDLSIIKNCFFKAADGECVKADFNNDGYINAGDLAQFKISGRFDLNGDSIIDLHEDTPTNADLSIIKSCFNQATQECLIADFSGDGVVNAADLALFKAAVKYDLNEDQIVDLRG
jgi:hypothetical protein